MSLALLGILNSQAAGGGAGAYDLLETVTLANNTVLSLQGVDAYSGYKHLQIRYTANSYGLGGGFDYHFMYLNNVSGLVTGYSHQIEADGSTIVGGGTTTGDTGLWLNKLSKRGTSSQQRTAGIIDLLDFSNPNKKTTLRSITGFSNGGVSNIALQSAHFNQTDAINRIDIECYSNFASGSRFSIYGIKG